MHATLALENWCRALVLAKLVADIDATARDHPCTSLRLRHSYSIPLLAIAPGAVARAALCLCNQQNQAAYYNQIAAYKQAQGANIGAIGQSLFNLMQAKQYGKSIGQAGKLKAIN